MHEEYRHIGTPAMRIIEECGEVLQALSKCERFGHDGFHPDQHPDNHEDNLDRLEGEVNDVVEALKDYKASLK